MPKGAQSVRSATRGSAAAAARVEDLAAFAALVEGDADRDEVVAGAVRLLCRTVGCGRGGLLLPEPGSGLLRMEAPAFGVSPDVLALLPALDQALDDGLLAGLEPGRPGRMTVEVAGEGWAAGLARLLDVRDLTRVSFLQDGRLVALFVGETAQTEPPMEVSGDGAALALLSSLLVLWEQRRQGERLLAQERYLVHMHDVLTHEAVDNRPLSQIVARLARESGTAVILEDRLLRPLAVAEPGIRGSESPAALAVPEGVKQATAFRSFLQQLIKSGAPGVPPAAVKGLPHRRLMMAVIGASRHLGFLSLVEGGRPLQDTDRAVLSIGAGAIALKMLYEKIALDVEENIKQDFLCNVVTNNYTTETAIIEKANYLGYNINLPFNVIVIMWVNPKTGAAEVIPAPVIGYVKQKMREWSPRSIVSSFRSVQLFVLADAEAEMVPDVLARKIVEVVSDQINAPYYVGVGKMVKRPQDIRHSFDQAKETVGIMQQMNRKNSIETYENLGAYSVLLGVRSISELESFALETLGRLMKHDSDRNVDLLHTLTVYLMEKGSHEDIARKLHIHVNTLKYRLQKIQELLGISLDDPEERFNVQLAIKALRVSKACRNWGS